MKDLLRRPFLPLRMLAASMRVLLWLILLAWIVFGATWATLHWVIVPRIGELRPELETRISRALGLQVRIGAIQSRTQGVFPTFEFSDVQLFDRQGRASLQLPRVLATLSPNSVWRLGFEQLVIDSPQLEVHRSSDGRLYVAGIEITPSKDPDTHAGDWVFSQSEWLIRAGTVVWRDDRRTGVPVALQQVELVMRNGVRSHALRLDVTPPAALGGRLSLRGRFRQPLLSTHAGAWQNWQGQLYAVFERVDINELRRHVELPFDVEGGEGALRTWIDVERGRLAGATADVALRNLGLGMGPERARLDLATLGGRLGLRVLDGGYELSSRGLRFATRDGLNWPKGDFRVSLVSGRDPSADWGELHARGMDLSVLASLAGRLPMQAAVHEALTRIAPQGVVDQLEARWNGPLQSPERYDVRGKVRQLAFAAQPVEGPVEAINMGVSKPSLGLPGVRGLDVDFLLNQDGGRAGLQVQQGHVEFPGLFEQPRVALDQFAAEMQWRVKGDALSVQLINARVRNDDAQGDFQLKWQTARAAGAARFPGILEMQGTLNRAEVAAVHRYMPLLVKVPVREYLKAALPQGNAGSVRFVLRGDLSKFPFAQPGEGEFRISANVQNGRFVYVPAHLQTGDEAAWPALTQVSADLLIDHASLQLRNVAARLDGAPQVRISHGEARIPDMGEAPRVQAHLQLHGALDEWLRGMVAQSPLDRWLGGALGQARARGNVEGQLRLDLPLNELHRSAVQGRLTLAGNDLQLAPQAPRLTRLRGVVHFSERGFALSGVQARLLGGEVRAEGGTIAVPGEAAGPGAPRLRVQGVLTAEGLRQETALGPVARLARKASGATRYEAEFALRHGVPELLVQSSLQGLALDLPVPLNKTASETLPLRLLSVVNEPAAGAQSPLQDQLRFNLGRLVAIHYVRDVSAPRPRVLRGTVGIGLPPGESLPMPDSGVLGSLQFNELDLDVWNALVTDKEAAPTQRTALSPVWRDYLPTILMTQGQVLAVGGQRFNQVVMGSSREGPVWRSSIEARELGGYVEYTESTSAGAGRLYGRMARLILAPSGARSVENLLEDQPISIPSLDVIIDQLELRGKKLGRAEIEAYNLGAARRDAGALEWRLSRLRLRMPEATLDASGSWAIVRDSEVEALRPPSQRARTETRRTSMTMRMDIQDAGGLLARLGMPDVIRRGKGHLTGDVSWMGSPLALDYGSLGGNLNLNVENGQFLKADPGLAKLLGVLSLQSLPRRLTLDFRDVFSEGFAFDFVRGDARIERGVASTNNLQMKGVNAAVLMDGQADISRETQDLKIVVVPEINAGTASLIASWINPAVGLGSFLAQLILRGPMIESATQEFRITGSWSEPQIVRTDKPADTAPKAEGSP